MLENGSNNSNTTGVIGVFISFIPNIIESLPDFLKIISSILGFILIIYSIRYKIIESRVKKLELKNLKDKEQQENKILELLKKLEKGSEIPKDEVENMLNELKNNNSNLEELYKKRYGEK